MPTVPEQENVVENTQPGLLDSATPLRSAQNDGLSNPDPSCCAQSQHPETCTEITTPPSSTPAPEKTPADSVGTPFEKGAQTQPDAPTRKDVPTLRVTELEITYTDTLGEKVNVVSDLSFSVEPGQLCCLAGRSGSGKTSVVRALVGLITPTSGTITWDGVEIRKLSPAELADQRRKITAYVDQEASLITGLNVLDNLLLPAIPDGRAAVAEAKTKAAAYLNQLGLEKRRSWAPLKLSGGERQRVALARALGTNTPVIIADEPTASLDRRWAENVISLIKTHTNNGGIVIAASHDPALAAASDIVINLDEILQP
jgi:ABC-type lipoprotein export system ATPase subunit